jgi:hypothetical protein
VVADVHNNCFKEVAYIAYIAYTSIAYGLVYCVQHFWTYYINIFLSHTVEIEHYKLLLNYIRIEVYVVVTMKNAIFWDVTLCSSYKNCRFEECMASISRVKRTSDLGTVLALARNSSTLRRSTLMIEAIRFPETSVLTRATWHHILEDGILPLNYIS